jgi:negative regulator of sigma E activity
MDVEIQASLPSLKKQGRLHALRRISALGRITYEMLRFEGDGTVKNQVIARYLTAEAEAQKDQAPSLAVTPANYKFKYKSRDRLEGRDVYIFQVTPRQKRQGLFKGEVWIDAGTHLRVQESGYLVKNPSIFLKKVAFVRKYEIRDGISVPLQVQSEVDTRLAGKAELTIDFSNFSMDGPKRGAMSDAGSQ